MLEQFQLVGEDLFRAGLVDCCGGNMSVKAGDKIFITRRYCMLGRIKDGDLIEVPLEGEINAQASRELIVHRSIYCNTSAKAIVHAHGSYSVALSLTENKIMLQDSEGQFFFNQGVPIVKTRTSIGSEEVAKLIPSFFSSGNNIVMVKGHGSFAIGDSLEKCLQYTSILENSCKILALSRIIAPKSPVRESHPHQHKSAIPPGLGVMDRTAMRRARAYKSQNMK